MTRAKLFSKALGKTPPHKVWFLYIQSQVIRQNGMEAAKSLWNGCELDPWGLCRLVTLTWSLLSYFTKYGRAF